MPITSRHEEVNSGDTPGKASPYIVVDLNLNHLVFFNNTIVVF